jgi:L-lactate dehydrogenase complex protein LldG
MSSKDVILGRIRSALRDQPSVPAIPRDYRRQFDPADLDLFVERLVDYKAVVHRGDSVAATIKGISGTRTLIVPPGLDRSWLPPEVSPLVDEALPADRIAAADGVVTAAAVGIAETGTIVLDASPDQGRRIISLLPDLHICVIRASQVVAAVPEAVARLDPTRPLTWISGPSATSDIELNRVEGVHGPRNLHVILTDD